MREPMMFLSAIALGYVIALIGIVFVARMLGKLPWRELGQLLAFAFVTSSLVIAAVTLFSLALTGSSR